MLDISKQIDLSLEEASHGYKIFKEKEDDCIEVVLKP